MKLDRRLALISIYGILLEYCCRYLSLLPSFYETHAIGVECKRNVVLLNFGKKKKTHASSICKRFLFAESNGPLKLRPPKPANSESNESRYYRNSTVLQKPRIQCKPSQEPEDGRRYLHM